MSDTISREAIDEAIRRVCRALIEASDRLTELDQAMGDGDTGITLTKASNALAAFVDDDTDDDIGRFLAAAGMAVNRAAPSTLGTLTATALMSAGKSVKGKTDLTIDDTVIMFASAVDGIVRRGKAKPGDKTVVDAVAPASTAYAAAVARGDSLHEAGVAALGAAREGRDRVTPLRSKIGRASWLGERTEGLIDPGCEAFVVALEAFVGED